MEDVPLRGATSDGCRGCWAVGDLDSSNACEMLVAAMLEVRLSTDVTGVGVSLLRFFPKSGSPSAG